MKVSPFFLRYGLLLSLLCLADGQGQTTPYAIEERTKTGLLGGGRAPVDDECPVSGAQSFLLVSDGEDIFLFSGQSRRVPQDGGLLLSDQGLHKTGGYHRIGGGSAFGPVRRFATIGISSQRLSHQDRFGRLQLPVLPRRLGPVRAEQPGQAAFRHPLGIGPFVQLGHQHSLGLDLGGQKVGFVPQVADVGRLCFPGRRGRRRRRLR